MERENLDIGEISNARRESIKRSIHIVDIEELKSLGESLFQFQGNPWKDVYFQLIKESAGSTFYRATTYDGVEIIYCRAKEKGMWFIPKNGMGPLQAEGLEMMKEIVDERRTSS